MGRKRSRSSSGEDLVDREDDAKSNRPAVRDSEDPPSPNVRRGEESREQCQEKSRSHATYESHRPRRPQRAKAVSAEHNRGEKAKYNGGLAGHLAR
jgi:hypothetical protein